MKIYNMCLDIIKHCIGWFNEYIKCNLKELFHKEEKENS
jgi:hypothetical protein